MPVETITPAELRSLEDAVNLADSLERVQMADAYESVGELLMSQLLRDMMVFDVWTDGKKWYAVIYDSDNRPMLGQSRRWRLAFLSRMDPVHGTNMPRDGWVFRYRKHGSFLRRIRLAIQRATKIYPPTVR